MVHGLAGRELEKVLNWRAGFQVFTNFLKIAEPYIINVTSAIPLTWIERFLGLLQVYVLLFFSGHISR